MELEEQIKQIMPTEEEVKKMAKRRWDNIAKPLNSLGKLEDVVVKMAAIIGSADKIKVQKPALVIMCADHGVVEEGVTQTGKEVTKIVADNFTIGKTSVAVMANSAGIDLFPIDIGMDCISYDNGELVPSVLVDRKIGYGTNNLAKEAAMSDRECRDAIQVGIDIVKQLKEQGYDLIATGEMGIGNTTPSSALASVLLGKEVEEVTGRGAGLSTEGLCKKINAIQKGIARLDQEKKEKKDVIYLLSQLGGFDLAGMTGLFLGGAIYRIPVIIDGFISSVSALIASYIAPSALDYMIASHRSKEPAGNMLIKALKADPFLDCNMCLGEGTGAILSVPLLRMATEIYMQMSTFEEIEVEAYQPL